MARIHYLGALAICMAALTGLGGQWFQRNRLEGLKGKAGPVEFEAGLREDVAPSSSVTTTTTTEVKP